jgi:phosphoribosylformylglycinamidine cyclo-ligase
MTVKGVPHAVKEVLEGTYNYNVKSRVGDYAGVYQLAGSGVELISSTDGVGTKIKVACSTDDWPECGWSHCCIGQDLVNHCVNDILVCGATPLFFLNTFSYGNDAAKEHMPHVVRGMAKAARVVDMPLISGETAKIPGIVVDDAAGTYDLVGTIIGYTSIGNRITGERVAKEDRLIAIPSSGIHTNGFTTIRRVFCSDESTDGAKNAWERNQYVEGGDLNLGMSLRHAVMQPHRCYYSLVKPMLGMFEINAIAHITGGGIDANLRRVVNGHKYEVRWGNWEWPRMFRMIQRYGDIQREKMEAEFNLGVGLILVVPQQQSQQVYWYLRTMGEHPQVIGEIVD